MNVTVELDEKTWESSGITSNIMNTKQAFNTNETELLSGNSTPTTNNGVSIGIGAIGTQTSEAIIANSTMDVRGDATQNVLMNESSVTINSSSTMNEILTTSGLSSEADASVSQVTITSEEATNLNMSFTASSTTSDTLINGTDYARDSQEISESITNSTYIALNNSVASPKFTPTDQSLLNLTITRDLTEPTQGVITSVSNQTLDETMKYVANSTVAMTTVKDGSTTISGSPLTDGFLHINVTSLFENVTDFSTTINPVTQNSNVTMAMYNATNTSNNTVGLLDSLESRSNYISTILFLFILIAIISNVLFVVSVAVKKDLHHLTYYFLVSMAIMHMVMSVVVMVPNTLTEIAGHYHPYVSCNIWISVDFFFCNCTFLHMAFVNMDIFLRLKDPLRARHRASVLSTCTRMILPWLVAFIQSFTEFIVSHQARESQLMLNVCLEPDGNFSILGILLSFFIPCFFAVLFHFLSSKEVKNMQNDVNGNNDIYRYMIHDAILDDATDRSYNAINEGSTNGKSNMAADFDQNEVSDDASMSGAESDFNDIEEHMEDECNQGNQRYENFVNAENAISLSDPHDGNTDSHETYSTIPMETMNTPENDTNPTGLANHLRTGDPSPS
ncbi:unnamed protein product, partial [Owenia fusiformis]